MNDNRRICGGWLPKRVISRSVLVKVSRFFDVDCCKGDKGTVAEALRVEEYGETPCGRGTKVGKVDVGVSDKVAYAGRAPPAATHGLCWYFIC